MSKTIQRNTGRLEFASVSTMRSFTGGSGLKNGETVYLYDDSNPGTWKWDTGSSATDDGVDVVKITSWVGNGRFLRLRSNAENISPDTYGAAGDGATDDSSAFAAMATAEIGRIIIPAGKSYRITSQINFSSKVRIDGPGTIICDWDELTDGSSSAYAFVLAGDESVVDGVRFTVKTIEGTPETTTAGYDAKYGTDSAAIHVTGDKCQVRFCGFDYQPQGVYKSGSDESIQVIGCYGKGYFDGTVATAGADWNFIHVYDGKNCVIRGNFCDGYVQAILFDLSTNDSVIDGNIAINCTDHLVYVSSGYGNVISNNVGVGKFCNIKARGFTTTISGNELDGGTIEHTNQIADNLPTTQAHFACSITGNTVFYEGGTLSGIYVNERTGFAATLRNVTISGNSVHGTDKTDGPLRGISLDATGYDGVTISGNSVNNCVSDGIFIAPSTTPTNGVRFSITGNMVHGCGGNGIQANGDYGAITGNLVYDCDQSGSNDGLILLGNANWVTVSGNTCVDSNGGAGVGIREVGTSNNNVITSNLLKDVGTGISKVGANTIVKDNNGEYVDHNWGVASVANGDTIAHGISGTPSMVNLTASAPNRIVTCSRDGTNITVGLTQADGSTAIVVAEDVFWEARL